MGEVSKGAGALAADPFEQFLVEFRKANDAGISQAEAVSLATTGNTGQPSLRTVLYKGLVRGGFSFYTNYESTKAKALAENPRASLLFFWEPLAQQVRIEGSVAKLTRAESEAYFKTRARLSQLGAWASAQSERIASTAELQAKVDAIDARFNNQEVPCPPNWGGYHLVPLMMEFWYGKSGRLHERFVYERATSESAWTTHMKSP